MPKTVSISGASALYAGSQLLWRKKAATTTLKTILDFFSSGGSKLFIDPPSGASSIPHSHQIVDMQLGTYAWNKSVPVSIRLDGYYWSLTFTSTIRAAFPGCNALDGRANIPMTITITQS